MALVHKKAPAYPHVLILPLAFSLLFAACGGSGGDDDDDSSGSAETTISIAETLNVSAGAPVLLEAQNESISNGSGISKIIAASASSPQPGNGYTASTIDIANVVANSVADTLDFSSNSLGSNATAAQLAAFFELQSSELDASASTTARLTLSTPTITFADQFSLNGNTITGNTPSEVMADINALPNIVATIDGNSVITVTISDGDDLRLDLNNAASGQSIGIESLDIDSAGTTLVMDSLSIGDGLPNTKATIGGVVTVALNYPLQLQNAGNGNVFGTTLVVVYTERNGFNADDPDTYNHAGSVNIADSLGNNHTLTQYFVRQNDLAGTNPNRWKMYVMIDDRHLGANDSNGNPTPAGFDLVFDSNGQLDTTATDAIEISQWVPLDSNGNPNNAATARVTIDITGSTQFAGPFTLANVYID